MKWPGHLSEEAGKIVAQGWAEFIHKPIEPSVLISTIQRLLGGLDLGRTKDTGSVTGQEKRMASKILLIHNNNASRTAIANFLRENGFEVGEVVSGLEAAFRLYKGARFDLAIYDANLADSDRITFARALRSTHPAIPIIGLSSFPSNADRVLFVGRTEFIRKPVSLEHLLFLALSLIFRPCRRKIGMQTWHLCTDCKDWPDSDYEEIPTNPFGKLELCNECRLNHSQGKCL